MAEVVTGTDAIRSALYARSRKYNIAGLAREVGCSSSELESFIAGRLHLQPEILKALARQLFEGFAEFDPTINRLRSVRRQEPKPLGNAPAPVKATAKVWPVGSFSPGPQPVKPIPPKPKITKPGWVE